MTWTMTAKLFRKTSLAAASFVGGSSLIWVLHGQQDDASGTTNHTSTGSVTTTSCEPTLPASSSTQTPPPPSTSKSRLIFLGTGSSTGCPRPACPITFSPQAPTSRALEQYRRDMASFCRTSNLAGQGDPVTNKDYRNNPCLLISVVDQITHEQTNVMIDVGKTFRETALRWLPRYGIASVDAIFLTHQHMDAAGGLDEVRGFQKWMFPTQQQDGNQQKQITMDRPTALPMPLYVAQDHLECLQDQFPWLLPKKKNSTIAAPSSNNKPVITRHVASFNVTVLKYFQPQTIPNGVLTLTPLPVMHGEDLVAAGYSFTVGTTNVVYLSDISRMLPATLHYIQQQLPRPTHILVLDALHPETYNATHFHLQDAVVLARQIRPQQVYLVGMNCDAFLPHDQANEQLRREFGDLNIQLAHDGLVIEV